MSHRRTLFIIFWGLLGALLFGIYTPRVLLSIYDAVTPAPQLTQQLPIPKSIANDPVAKKNFIDMQGSANAAEEVERIRIRKDATRVTSNPISVLAASILGLLLGIGLARIQLRAFESIGRRWQGLGSGQKVTLFVGVFLGLIASLPFLFLLNSLNLVVYIPLAVVGLTLGFTVLSVYALQSMEEFLPWSKGLPRAKRSGIKILDTNVLIDGRIYDVARTGFLAGPYYVPGFVLDELQYIADSSQALRRQRGRRGLDVLRLMQAEFNVDVRTHDKHLAGVQDAVDSKLVRLATAIGGDIVTNDFNLNRVATVQGVKVLNINDLALALRPNVLPTETIELTILREGNQPGQGIGYLEDGTMVVIENGRQHLGETHEVIVTQVIQTERGKMIFAEVDGTRDRRTKARRSAEDN